MIIHNQYALGLGRARNRYTSLPQGCPFSMRFLALMMVPWHQQIKIYGAIPRSLADDLLHYAKGPNSTHVSAQAFLFTNEYIIHMGSKATISKTFAFGSHQASRNAHKQVWFAQQPNDEIKVLNETRDIGGHLELIGHRTNTTGTKRMNDTTKEIKSHSTIPSHPHARYTAVISKYLPKALYGCSTAPINLKCMRDFISAIADFALGKSPHLDRNTRSPILALYISGPSPYTTIDPWFYVLRQTCIDFRTCFYLSKDVKHILMDTLKQYVDEGIQGTRPSGDHGITFSMPYLQKGSVALWRHPTRPKGPVAILLQTLAAFTCYLDEEATLISPYAPPVNLLLSPLHTIQRTLYIICEASVFDVLGLSRQNFLGQRTIDREVTTQLINHPTPTPKPHDDVVAEFGTETRKAKKMIEYNNEAHQDVFAAQLPNDYECPKGKIHQHPCQPWMITSLVDGHFNNHKAFKSKYIESPACPLCGAPRVDQEHITNFCEAVKYERHMDKRLAKLAPNLMDIPRCLRVHGIAPALSADIAGSLLGREDLQVTCQ